MIWLTLLVVGLAAAFAVSIGAHYTGACMGMPYAAGAIRLWTALGLMAPFVLFGALLASGAVETTVGHGILAGGAAALPLAAVIVGTAFALTSAYNFVALPTSTIQILVFCAVGAGLGAGRAIEWTTIERLLVVWATAPLAASGLGYLFTRLFDRTGQRGAVPTGARLLPALSAGLIAVGVGASFTMGANDVANASGILVMTGRFGLLEAAAIGGAGMFVGVLTWGQPLLRRVAFGIVRLDPRTAVASQLAQCCVVLVSVSFGFFTSLNQALVGGMVGAGTARGKGYVSRETVRSILLGWGLGPASGVSVGLAASLVLRWAHAL